MNKNTNKNFFFLPGQLNQWEKFNKGNIEVWLASINKKDKFESINKYLNLNYHFNIKKIINILGDHFGIIIITKNSVFVATDLSRSYPIYWKNKNNKLYFSPQAHLLKDYNEQIKEEQLLAFRMSGYTTDNHTLWKKIYNMRSGSYLFYKKNSKLIIKKYFLYKPWQIKNKNIDFFKNNLKKEINKLFLNIIKEANGRTLIVPLSAGLDSRLIISGLKENNYNNVKCFTYGLKNNFEYKVAQKIAKKLEYDIEFVEITQKKARDFFNSKYFTNYLKLTNDGISVPTIHSLFAIHCLLKTNYIKKNDILINGNSGDFISGGHIPKNIKYSNKSSKSMIFSFNKVFDVHFLKHYSLWEAFINRNNRTIIKNILLKQLHENIPRKTRTIEYSLLEFLEFENRQTKHVINCQRVYDYYKLDWLLPLWNKSFIKFWQKVPLKYKLNQLLYKEVLSELDYGGVWTKDYYIKPYLTPRWLSFFKLFIKVFFIFLGKNKWHKFERRYFNYWTNIICDLSINSYLDTIKNKNGFRHAVSFLALKIEKLNLGKSWK